MQAELNRGLDSTGAASQVESDVTKCTKLMAEADAEVTKHKETSRALKTAKSEIQSNEEEVRLPLPSPLLTEGDTVARDQCAFMLGPMWRQESEHETVVERPWLHADCSPCGGGDVNRDTSSLSYQREGGACGIGCMAVCGSA